MLLRCMLYVNYYFVKLIADTKTETTQCKDNEYGQQINNSTIISVSADNSDIILSVNFKHITSRRMLLYACKKTETTSRNHESEGTLIE